MHLTQMGFLFWLAGRGDLGLVHEIFLLCSQSFSLEHGASSRLASVPRVPALESPFRSRGWGGERTDRQVVAGLALSTLLVKSQLEWQGCSSSSPPALALPCSQFSWILEGSTICSPSLTQHWEKVPAGLPFIPFPCRNGAHDTGDLDLPQALILPQPTAASAAHCYPVRRGAEQPMGH